MEFRVGVGEWWGVFSHKEQEKQEVSGVGEKSWRVELESEVGGESEGQRPESRLAHESMFAGPV